MKLLPCPFCGSDALIYKDDPDHGYNSFAAECQNEDCCASTAWMDNEKDAVTVWNNRSSTSLRKHK